MRRIIALTVSVLVGAALLVPAQASAGKGKKQEVEGSIALMAPFPLDLNACYSGLHRRLAIVGGDNANGVVGFHFDVDPATYGKNFVLELVDGGDQDLDITFYSGGFGELSDAPNNPQLNPPGATISFEDRGPGGEHGQVPAEGDFDKAIICMHSGTDASFKYTAGKGVKIPKDD